MRRERTSKKDERAVSEAISYVLVFGLITAGTLLVALQGAPAISNTQDEQVAENSKRAVVLLQERVEEMVRQDAPSREISVNVQDIRVGVGDMEPARFNITALNSSGGAVDIADVETDPVYIETTAGEIDQTAAYENGAVILGQRDPNADRDWTMSNRPSWAIRTNSSTGEVRSVFLSTISTEGSTVVTGERTSARLIFETVRKDSSVLRNAKELEISVESPRSGAWEEYMRRVDRGINGSSLSRSGDEVTLKIDGFEGGEGRVTHRTRFIRTEVTNR